MKRGHTQRCMAWHGMALCQSTSVVPVYPVMPGGRRKTNSKRIQNLTSLTSCLSIRYVASIYVHTSKRAPFLGSFLPRRELSGFRNERRSVPRKEPGHAYSRI